VLAQRKKGEDMVRFDLLIYRGLLSSARNRMSPGIKSDHARMPITCFIHALSLACLVAISLAPRARAQNITDPPQCSGVEQLAECLDIDARKAEGRLKAAYRLIINMTDAGAVDPAASFFLAKKKALDASEQAWARYREAQCAAETAMIAPASAAGVVQAMGGCTLRLTRERVSYLERVAASLKGDSKLCQHDAKVCLIR